MASNLGPKVSTSQLTVGDIVRKHWGSEFNAPDHGVYMFSNGRKFDSTDRGGNSGLYAVTGGLLIQPFSARYPDMYAGVVLAEDGTYIIQD